MFPGPCGLAQPKHDLTETIHPNSACPCKPNKDARQDASQSFIKHTLAKCAPLNVNNPQRCVCADVRVGGDNQFQASKVGRYHFIRAEESAGASPEIIAEKETLPRPQLAEEG